MRKYEDLSLLLSLYGEREIKHPAVIIDADHNNAGNKRKEQIRIVKEVLCSRRQNREIGAFVRVVMPKRDIEEGCQPVSGTVCEKSITGSCLSREDSEQLLYEIAELV